MIREFINSIGGRKFLFAVILLIILATMTISEVEGESVKLFFNYALTIFTLYVGGNVAQKFSSKDVIKSDNE